MVLARELFKALCGVAAMAMSISVVAQDGLKVGYVNAAKIVELAPQGEAALKKLEKEFGPRDDELRAMRDEINNLENDLEKNSLVMSESDRREKEKQLRDLNRSLKRSRQEFREDYNLRRNEELAKLQREISKAIVEIAKTENYDIILQDLVWASENIDITEKVLKKLGKE